MKFDKYQKLGAYHYQWYDDPNWAWYKECVDRCVKFCNGCTLDVGCGDGLLANKLSKKVDYVHGVDTSVDGLKIALEMCKEPSVRFELLDVESEDIGAEFDYMTCLNVIEHLKKPDSLIKILRNNITKGAIIITDVPTGHVGRYHEHEFTKKELMDLFKEFKPKYFRIDSTEHGKPISFHGVEIVKK